MCDCDKLIDPFCGNRAVLITGNAVQLSHIRSLTWSHNNKLTQPSLFFLLVIFLKTILFNAVQLKAVSSPRRLTCHAPYFHYRVLLKLIMLVYKQPQTVLTALTFSCKTREFLNIFFLLWGAASPVPPHWSVSLFALQFG